MLTEEITVNLPADQAYHSLLKYLKDNPIYKHDEVKRFSDPSYVEVKLGGSLSLLNVIVRIYVIPQEDKSRIKVDFDFKRYLSLLVSPIILMFSYIVTLWLTYRPPLSLDILRLYMLTFVVLAFGISLPVRYVRRMRRDYKNKISAFLEGMERASANEKIT